MPHLFPNRTSDNACLQLFDSPHGTHANILGTHREAAINATERHAGVVLLIHDAKPLLGPGWHAYRGAATVKGVPARSFRPIGQLVAETGVALDGVEGAGPGKARRPTV